MEDEDELSTELELVGSMYSPEELVVSDVGSDDVAKVIEYNVSLDRIMITLKFSLPPTYPVEPPAPVVQVTKSRGLIDSQEANIKKSLEQQCVQTFEEFGRYSLVELLLMAKDIAQLENDKGGTCAICLCDIEVGEDVFRANCWHIFHSHCFAAWWKQLEERRLSAGGEVDAISRQRKQLLSAANARVTERQDVSTELGTRLGKLKQDKKKLEELLGLINTIKKMKVPNVASLPSEYSELKDFGFRTVSRKLATVQDNMKTVKEDIDKNVVKLVKATKEKGELEEEIQEKENSELRQDIECPVCKGVVQFAEIEPFLLRAVGSLKADSSSDTLVPQAWVKDAELKPEEMYSSLLSQDELEKMQRSREQRVAMYEKQKAQGSIIDKLASDIVTLTNDVETILPEPKKEQTVRVETTPAPAAKKKGNRNRNRNRRR
mmetsp:Transcript_19361/g.31863  ORF Transcript_19361/g.31863 Transcript_19361/m.31863 type:complete len:434 (-) Transcript_19361:432-1733(-)